MERRRFIGVRRFLIYGLGLLALPLFLNGNGGCQTGSIALDGTDDTVFFPAIRTIYHLTPPQPGLIDSIKGKSDEGERKAGIGSAALDFDLAYGIGQSSTDVPSGRFLIFDGDLFDGPMRVRSTAHILTGSVAFRGGLWLFHTVGIEPIIGLGVTYADVEVRGSDNEARDRTLTTGLLLGAQVSLRPASWLTFYGRGTGTGNNETGIFRGELGVLVKPYPHVALMAGVRRWIYEEERRGQDGDVQLTLSGPTLALNLLF